MNIPKTSSHHSATGAGPSSTATDETRWSAEWEGSTKLQAEYPTAASYAATMKRRPSNRETGHAVSALARPSGSDADAGLKAAWQRSSNLQAEYPTAASYVATMKRQAR